MYKICGIVVATVSLLGAAQATGLNDLPNELKSYIGQFLDAKSISKLSQTCKEYRDMFKSPIFLKEEPHALLDLLGNRNEVEKRYNCSLTEFKERVRGLRLEQRSYPPIPDDFYQKLVKELPYLEVLEGRLPQNESSDGFKHFNSLNHLKKLDLRGCYWFVDDNLVHLRGLTNLQTLDLSGRSRITDAGLYHLSLLKNLQTLNLSGCTQVTDAVLANLSGLTNLRTLELGANCILIPVSEIHANLSHSGSCDQITDAGLAHLSSLTNLQELSLRACDKITNDGLAHLLDMANLQILDLSGCNKITDNALVYLRVMISLHVLILDNCKNITEYAINELRRALPSCRIIHYVRSSQGS